MIEITYKDKEIDSLKLKIKHLQQQNKELTLVEGVLSSMEESLSRTYSIIKDLEQDNKDLNQELTDLKNELEQL